VGGASQLLEAGDELTPMRELAAGSARPTPVRTGPLMDLSIVVVNYRSRDALLSCLASLPDSAHGLEYEVAVIDNASGDGSPEALARWQPDVRLIQNLENVGFASAVNQGIRATTGDFVMLLNPDCVLHAGAARRLADYLRAHPRCGIAAPRLVYPDGSLQLSARHYPDASTLLFNRYSLFTLLFPRNPWSRRYLMSDWDHASVRDVDWVAGACLMARRDAIREVGEMDEAFFMFNEDVDWCRRMNQARWAVTYVPDAVCVHHVGVSHKRSTTRVILERHRGMAHYFHKHHPTPPPLSWAVDALLMARGWMMVLQNSLRRD
jgi:GT2 family glycosyltransferase